MIYHELENKEPKKMWGVMFYGTAGATIAYLFAGIFGYVCFAANPDVDRIMNIKNILLAYPDTWANFISLIGILMVMFLSTPLTILPCKATLEELFLNKGEKLNSS